nr:hypothetical protein GCM10020092_026500 [Actinoplanes digitatis]
MVMVHARALLNSTPEGRTTYLEADLRSPEAIVADPALRETLDLGSTRRAHAGGRPALHRGVRS